MADKPTTTASRATPITDPAELDISGSEKDIYYHNTLKKWVRQPGYNRFVENEGDSDSLKERKRDRLKRFVSRLLMKVRRKREEERVTGAKRDPEFVAVPYKKIQPPDSW